MGQTPEEQMQEFLTGSSRAGTIVRRVFRRVPHGPNCKICSAPFEGPGGAILRHVGFGRYAGNPAICNFCIKDLQRMGVQGAEIPVSLLFADIRGSTTIGERMSPTDFRAFLGRFYRIASEAVLANDGIVDKFVGDEVIGLFFGGVSGDRHAAAAVAAGRNLLSRAGRDDATPNGPIPIGAAVHTGTAFVGSTASEDIVNDFTALGDVVNTTARLASQAASGEILVLVDAAAMAGIDVTNLEPRTVEVRGRTEPVEVIGLRSSRRRQLSEPGRPPGAGRPYNRQARSTNGTGPVMRDYAAVRAQRMGWPPPGSPPVRPHSTASRRPEPRRTGPCPGR